MSMRSLWSAGTPILVALLSLMTTPSALHAQPREEPTADNLFTGTLDVRMGQRVFRQQCGRCHGRDGSGGEGGPDLTNGFRSSSTDAGLFQIVREGIPNTQMAGISRQSTDQSTWMVVSYLNSLNDTTEVDLPGSATNGQQLFAGKGNCSSCHMVSGDGGRRGPDLTQVGNRREPEELMSDLRTPDEDVAPRWWTLRVTQSDGSMLEGLRMNEDTFSMRLMDDDENLWSLSKSDVRSYDRVKTSTMPTVDGALTDAEVDDLVAYLFSLRRGGELNMKRLASIIALGLFATGVMPAAAQETESQPGATPSFSPVTWERLLNAKDEPENWLMYSGTLDSQHFSGLDQVHNRNVGDLELKWAYQIPQLDRAETVPVVVDGIMFITEAPSNVVAVDAATGRQYWRYNHPLPDDLRICCGRNNRGVAILGETLYMSTLDAHLVAIDARSGNLVWDRELADYRAGYSKTAAPLIVKDEVVTGMAGGEYGVRGFIDSYNAKSGELEWRADTIPGPDHPDNQTWAGDSWRTGGSATWITGAYDPDLDLVYWGTGNPGPDWNGDVRMGDNLYSDSALALNHETGAMEWYFQFTPHDVHDWDAIQVPILADLEMDGEMRKVMMWANRNAFFYTIDRVTGEFLVGKPFAKQTWAEGLDSNGRPIRIPDTFPTAEGTTVSPPVGGGTNWFSPAYSPRTELFYVQAYDGEDTYFKRDEDYVEGDQFTGGGGQRPGPVDDYQSAIRAIDPKTGNLRWEYEIQPRSTAGIMATAGDLVFSGSVDGYFFALDAVSGDELWHMNVGRLVHSSPMSFAVDGKQYITIAAGNVVYTFGLRD